MLPLVSLRASWLLDTQVRVRVTLLDCGTLSRHMLQLDNKTPYAAERTIVMSKTGEKSWVVVVRAAYYIRHDGTTELLAEQKQPLYAAEHTGVPGESSIRYETDMIPTKPATDVVINGQAYAPQGKPASAVTVAITVGPLRKSLVVFGDRHWEVALMGGLIMSSPTKFDRMPIIYEHAFGGWDKANPENEKLYPQNPIGRGFATKSNHLDGHRLPNVEYPHHLISSWKDRPPTAGLGAIASYWSPRLEWGGTYDADWLKHKMPLLPDDFDDRFYQCAPVDQQVRERLRGGEPVTLQNLTEAGFLRFVLPKVYLTFSSRFGKRRQEHRGSLQTVIIEPDLPLVTLVWQTSLACHHSIHELDRV